MVRSLARLAAASLALSASAAAQVDVAWSDGFAPLDEPGRLALDAAAGATGGAIVALGTMQNDQLFVVEDLVIRRLDENGDRSWNFDVAFTLQNFTGLVTYEYFGGLAVDDDGDVAFGVMAADAARIRVLDASGALRWTRAFAPTTAPHASVASLEFIDSGDVIAVLSEDEFLVGGSTRRNSILRLDGATGGTVWRVDLDASRFPRVDVNAFDETAIVRTSGAGHVVERYDALGGVVSSTPLTFPSGAWSPRSVDVDGAGRIVAVHLDEGFNFRSAITSVDANGAVEWTTIEPDFGPGDVLANGDYVYPTQLTDAPLRRVRRDGTALNSVPVPVPDSQLRRVAAMPDGGFLAFGLIGSGGPSTGAFAARYDAAEQLAWQFDPTPGAFRYAFANGIALDARGNVILANSLRGQQLEFAAARTVKLVEGGDLGAGYCAPAIPNSTGAPASARTAGSDVVASNNLTLLFGDLPPGSALLALASRTTGLVPNAGGSQGTLCLGGSIGRYAGPGQVRRADAAGSASLQLDLGTLPTPTGLVPAVVGETWSFQAWYRDANPQPTSNFTSATSVTMR
ncbi:MAG: hypothetical protein AAGB93_13910 [Planctomycetota bacterium]